MPQNNDIRVIQQNSTQSHTEIRDLIGNPPGWLLHSGISMVAIVTSILLVGSFCFKYPDKLVGHGILTSTTPPIEIISRTNGYIDLIIFEEGEEVNKGDIIIQINNTTDQAQLAQLQDWIEIYKNIKDPRDFLNLSFVHDLRLGTIQGEYANLQLKYNELVQTLKDGVVFQQINNLSREIEKIRSLNGSQEREISIFTQELELAQKDLERNENLNRDGAISDVDLERVKTSFLQKERQYQGMNNTIIQNNIRIEQLELEKLKLQEQRSGTIKNYQFSIAEIMARIQASIQNWNKTYMIAAPINGKITFTKDISMQKNIEQGQTIGHIIPSNHQEAYISAILPSANIGKVEKGQKAIIKFDAYPYKEYGVVTAKVSEISKIPEIDKEGIPQYEVKISVQDTIVTDYQDTILYKPKMTVIVDVITEDKTIFGRMFDQFLSLVNNQ